MSEANRTRTKLIRLIALMLSGAAIGIVVGILDPNLNDRRDFWVHGAPWVQAIVGTLCGLGIEVFLREIEPPRGTSLPAAKR
jgi:hypothetical protein